MSTVKRELTKVVEELSEDESGLLLKFAEWLKDQEEEFTDKDLAILHRGEQQIRKGEIVWWRDVKRTQV
jgi:hypothetical protein